MELLAWWNLVFLLPGSAGVVLALLSVVGMGGDHDADHDHDHDAGHDHDHGPLALPMHSGDSGGTVDPEEHGLFSGALSLLGVGHAPLMVVLMILCLSFGFLGISVNQMFGAALPLWQLFPLALGTALVGGVLVTGSASRLIGRIVPREESYATSFAALQGQTGKIVLLLSPTEGYAQLRDRYGNLQELRCRSLKGTPLHKNQPILVVETQTEGRLCLVVENELERRALPDGGMSE